MDNRDSEKPACRFFDLPRELRDEIYQLVGGVEALFHAERDRRKPVQAVYITDYPAPECRTVSRQFKAEYESCTVFRDAAILLVIELNNVKAPSSVFTNFKTGLHWAHLSRYHRLELALGNYGFVPQAQQEDQLERAIEAIHIDLPNIRSLTVNVTMDIRRFRKNVTKYPSAIDLFWSSASAQQTQVTGLHINRRLLLEGRLYEEIRSTSYPRWQELASPHTTLKGDNHITYLAKPSSGPYSWHGLELVVFEGGEVNREACDYRLLRSKRVGPQSRLPMQQ